MPLFNNFPYTNLHDLNIDWVITKVKELLQQGETLYASLEAWRTETDTELTAWKTQTMTDLNTWKTETQAAIASWESGVITDIAAQFTAIQTALAAWQAQAEAAWASTKAAAEAAQAAAETAQAGAEAAEASAEVWAEAAQSMVQDLQISPEETTFTMRANNATVVTPLESMELDLIKYPALSVLRRQNEDVLYTSSGHNCYVFHLPYTGFSFSIRYQTEVYTLTNIPDNEPNAELQNLTKIDPASTGTEWYNYTISLPSGTIILFDCLITQDPQYIHSNYNQRVNMPLLEYEDPRIIGSGQNDAFPGGLYKYAGKLLNSSTGGLTDNSSYDTYAFRVNRSSCTIYCSTGFRATRSIASPDTSVSNSNLIELVYAYSSGRVNPFTAYYGDWVAITVTAGTDPQITCDLWPRVAIPALQLGMGQANMYQLERSGNNTILHMWYPSGDHVIEWQLYNKPSAGSNSNTWQIGPIHAWYYDGLIIKNAVKIADSGEFELAFKERDPAFPDSTPGWDYCGGINHGDENTIPGGFTLLIDGAMVNVATMDQDPHPFNRIEAIEHALINRCNTPGDNILQHQKIWTFSNGGVHIDQTIKFLQTIYCDFEACMFPAIRAYFGYGVRAGAVDRETMTTDSYSRISTTGNDMMYLMYGDHASAIIRAHAEDHTPDCRLWINNAATMNKLYWNYFSSYVEIATDSVIKWSSDYRVSYD